MADGQNPDYIAQAIKSGGDIQCPDEKSCMSIHRFATPRISQRATLPMVGNQSIDTACMRNAQIFSAKQQTEKQPPVGPD
jgi:hypothetical protein